MRIPFRQLPKRAIAARAIHLSGAGSLLRRLAPWRGVLVLSYHRIAHAANIDTARSLVSASAEKLDRQLRFLQRECEVLDPGDVCPERLVRGPLRKRGRSVLIAFDDGYRDLYETAHPVLQANGVRAVMFLCSGFIDGNARAWWDEVAWIIRRCRLEALPPGRWSSRPLPLGEQTREHTIDLAIRACWGLAPKQIEVLLDELAGATEVGRRPVEDDAHDWITWKMARELRAAGHELGAHTLNHPILARLPHERQHEEIAGSVQRIEAETGTRPRWLAYPVGVKGVFDQRSRAAAAKAGIELAFSNYGGYVTPRGFNALDVQRVSAETLRTPELLAAVVTAPQVFARS